MQKYNNKHKNNRWNVPKSQTSLLWGVTRLNRSSEMVFQTTISIGKFSFSQYVTQQYVTAHCTRVKTHMNSKEANTKFYPICLRRLPSIQQLILSHLCQFWVFWEERRNRRTVFFESICCVTADLTSTFVIITLHWHCLQFWNILSRNLFPNCSETCSAFSGLQASAHHSQVPVVKLGGVYPLQGPSIGRYLHCSKYVNII